LDNGYTAEVRKNWRHCSSCGAGWTHRESFKPVSHDCHWLAVASRNWYRHGRAKADRQFSCSGARHPRPPGTTLSAGRPALRRPGIVQSSANFDVASKLAHATSFPHCQPTRICLSLVRRGGRRPYPSVCDLARLYSCAGAEGVKAWSGWRDVMTIERFMMYL